MDDKRFDDIIKNKVGSHSSSEGSDWMDFASLLEASKTEVTDQDFDEKIKSELESIQDEYQPSHWEILKEKLEAEEYIRTRLYLIKGIELSILLLFYMTFSTFFNPFEAIQQRLAQPVATSSPVAYLSGESSVNKGSGETSSYLIQDSPEDLENTEAINHSIESNSVESQVKVAAPSRSTLSKLPLLKDKDVPKVDLIRQVIDASPIQIEHSKVPLQSVAALPLIEQDLQINTTLQLEEDLFITIEEEVSRDGIYAFLSTDFNADIIDSPRDNVYPNYLSYLNYSKGYSMAVGVLNRSGRFDLGIGARYIQQLYSPRKISETIGGIAGGTRTTTLEKIEYDVLSIPVNLDYRIINKPSWNLFASAGLSMNIIGFAAYVAQEELNQRPSRRFNILHNKQVDSELDYLSQKDFDLGVFQGAPALDNLFMTASFGVGFEKWVGERTSVNLSTHYRHHLFSTEVGPNDDRIHSLVFSLGAKYKM